MKDNKLKLTLLRIALVVAVLMLAFMASYNVKAIGAMKAADKATNQARVTGWSIEVATNQDEANKNKELALAYNTALKETETNYYTAKVSNKSEAAGKYSLVVANVPEKVSVKLYKEGTTNPIPATEISGGKYIFENLEKLKAGQTGSNLKIEFGLTGAVSKTETKDILITFKVNQDHGEA